ncbi:hypothetical protein V8E36_009360 [Tilletia maclaganii]
MSFLSHRSPHPFSTSKPWSYPSTARAVSQSELLCCTSSTTIPAASFSVRRPSPGRIASKPIAFSTTTCNHNFYINDNPATAKTATMNQITPSSEAASPSCLGHKSLTTLAALAQRRLLISLESPSRDKAHPWFLAWMSAKAQAAAARQVRAMEAETIYSSDRMAHFRALTEFFSSSSSRDTACFSLVPGPGTHYFRYRGIWIRRLLDVTTGAPWETIKLTTLYAFGHILPQLLEDARAMSEAANSGKTVIVTDVEAFMRSGRWYAERGSGKTSLITALAGSHNLNLCLLSLSDRGMTDDKLLHLANAPERSILILEDIDVAFASRSSSEGGEGGQEEEGKRPSTNVTFSSLLNALDGVASSEERIAFMTTNHPERLDPALVRPGRVDRKFELGDADEEQVVRMMLRFYGWDHKRKVERQVAKVVMEESARRRRAAGLDPTTGLPPSSSPSTSTASSSPSSSSSSYLAPTCSKLSSTGNEEDQQQQATMATGEKATLRLPAPFNHARLDIYPYYPRIPATSGLSLSEIDRPLPFLLYPHEGLLLFHSGSRIDAPPQVVAWCLARGVPFLFLDYTVLSNPPSRGHGAPGYSLEDVWASIIATGHGAETDTGTQPRDEAWREFQPRGIDGRAGMIWGTGAGPATSTPTGRRARSDHPGPHNPTRAPPGLATDHPLHLCSRASRIGRGLKER